MTRAVYPGSFDPVTLGHMDIIRRASRVVDELVIGVLINRDKNPLFTVEERVEMLQESVKELKNVSVKTFDGRTVDFARANQAQIIIRGLRAVTDFEQDGTDQPHPRSHHRYHVLYHQPALCLPQQHYCKRGSPLR